MTMTMVALPSTMDDFEAEDDLSCSVSQRDWETDLSSFSAGSFSLGTVGSIGSSDSLDSIGSQWHLLVQLEVNDAHLTELIIDCRLIGAKTAAKIGHCLPNNTRLQKLFLHCGNRSGHRAREIFRHVISGLKNNKSIEFLEIQCVYINRETATLLVPHLAHSQRLKHFSLVDCKGPGLEDLFVALQQNTNIRRLAFHSCYWEDQNTDIMASILPLMKIDSLSLVDINIHFNGWPYLLRQIMQCRELIRLDLSGNDLDASVTYLLAKSLRGQKKISSLSLSTCCLNDECIKELSMMLRYHPVLTSLDISDNCSIGDNGVVHLSELLLQNNSITEMNMRGCSLSVQSRDSIERGLRYNNSFLHNICSFAIFDVYDTIFSPPILKCEETDIGKSAEMGTSGVFTIIEERDANKTSVNTLVEE